MAHVNLLFTCPVAYSLAWLLAKVPIHELLNELHALEFQDLRVLLQPTIKRHTELPGPREHLRVLNGGFVGERVETERRVTLDQMQGIAVEVPGPVKPGLVVQAGHVDDQSVPLPATDRMSHP